MSSEGSTVRVYALGGYGEIGMNCTVIEAEGRLLIVDCGVQFCAEPAFGAECRHPSFEFLSESADRIDSLILTHGHEDHVAAIPHLPADVRTTIIGGACTVGLVRSRLAETGGTKGHTLQVAFAGKTFNAGPFRVTPVALPHSILDNFGYLIEVAGRRILITGDYKLDALSKSQGLDTLAALEALRPLDLMIGDSTGAMESEDAGDEEALKGAVAKLMAGVSGRIYVALFSSNVSRIAHLAEAARACGRRVAFAGRSVDNHIAVAVEAGRTASLMERVIPVDDLGAVARRDAVVFISGSQGEPGSALHRLAEGTHRQLDIQEGDAVFLSSRAIPGNELAVARIVDRLLLQGAAVIHRQSHPEVHVSGHGSAGEIRAAICAVMPRAYLPAHGTVAHMMAGRRIAQDAGVPFSEVICDGDAVRFDDSGLTVEKASIPVKVVTLEGGVPVGDDVLKERGILGTRGFLVLELRLRQFVDIEIGRCISRGAFCDSQMPALKNDLQQKIRELMARAPDGKFPQEEVALGDSLRNPLRRHLKKNWNAEPYLIIALEARSTGES